MLSATLTPVDELSATIAESGRLTGSIGASGPVPRLQDFSGEVLVGFDGTQFFLFV